MTSAYSNLGELSLTTRTENALRRSGVYTIAQLQQQGSERIGALRNIGKKAVEEIRMRLSRKGIIWKRQGDTTAGLPALSPHAFDLVTALGLGDTIQVRRGLARVIRAVPSGVASIHDLAAELENTT